MADDVGCIAEMWMAVRGLLASCFMCKCKCMCMCMVMCMGMCMGMWMWMIGSWELAAQVWGFIYLKEKFNEKLEQTSFIPFSDDTCNSPKHEKTCQ